MKGQVNAILPGTEEIELTSDPAAEHPLYLYIKPDQVLYSTSIKNLLRDERVSVDVCPQGISFLLQCSVVPPPNTVYRNLYVLGVGDCARIRTQTNPDRPLTVEFKHRFPFFGSGMGSGMDPATESTVPTADQVLDALKQALEYRFDRQKAGFLFHSAGKDSNMVALAAARSGVREQITCITHKSKGKADESEISAAIARKLGLKHQVLHEVDQLGGEHIDAIERFFREAPFPGVDPVTLAYPVYTTQVEALVGANIIDGGGNDSYMMTPLSSKERKLLPLLNLSCQLPGLALLRNSVKTESLAGPLLKTPAEFYGMSGLSYADAKSVYAHADDHQAFWQQRSLTTAWPGGELDWVRHKTDIHTTITAAEVHIRKARNFADSIDANLILPFAHHQVAALFAGLPEHLLFDRNTGKNKLLIRRMLLDQLDLDSDAVGKMGYSYDFGSVIQQNRDFVYSHIRACSLWNQENMLALLARFEAVSQARHKYAKMCGRLIYRIFLISAWHLNCRYLAVREG
ncbi:asparagine synthase-related protein [Ketobacter sp.]|uniref:asparagine synthase-related protein n=1 Tax=Ketobacter sp. TaxID=2083498 RepID=UPI000F1A0AAF|nr:asparagine synthase-related protein [Ketobacter sp.]RLU01157.1 MAG: hypothetical protein D9N14_04225 [Ketobacter sp.]